MSEDELLHCSFCGRSEAECKHIIAAPGGACICSDCVLSCVAILFGEEEGSETKASQEQDKDEE